MTHPTHRNCQNTEWSTGVVFGCMRHSEGEVGRAEHSLLSSLSQTPLLKLPSYHHKVPGEWSAAVRIRNFPSWSTELPFEFHLLSAGLSWTSCLESQSPPSFIHKTKPFPAPIGVVALGKALEDSSHTWSRVYWTFRMLQCQECNVVHILQKQSSQEDSRLLGHINIGAGCRANVHQHVPTNLPNTLPTAVTCCYMCVCVVICTCLMHTKLYNISSGLVLLGNKIVANTITC